MRRFTMSSASDAVEALARCCFSINTISPWSILETGFFFITVACDELLPPVAATTVDGDGPCTVAEVLIFDTSTPLISVDLGWLQVEIEVAFTFLGVIVVVGPNSSVREVFDTSSSD